MQHSICSDMHYLCCPPASSVPGWLPASQTLRVLSWNPLLTSIVASMATARTGPPCSLLVATGMPALRSQSFTVRSEDPAGMADHTPQQGWCSSLQSSLQDPAGLADATPQQGSGQRILVWRVSPAGLAVGQGVMQQACSEVPAPRCGPRSMRAWQAQPHRRGLSGRKARQHPDRKCRP